MLGAFSFPLDFILEFLPLQAARFELLLKSRSFSFCYTVSHDRFSFQYRSDGGVPNGWITSSTVPKG